MQIHTIEGGNKKDAQVFYTNCASFNYSFTNNVFVLRIFFLCAILLKLNNPNPNPNPVAYSTIQTIASGIDYII